MNNNIGIIIGREFNERVKKKSFIIVTILTPLLMILLMIAPALVAVFSETETKQILVIDKSEYIVNRLESNEEVVFVPCSQPLDSARNSLGNKYGVLWIGKDIENNTSNIKLYTEEAASMSIENIITGQVKHIIEEKKLKAYNIENLGQILDDVKTDISLQTIKMEEDGGETSTSSIVSYVTAIILGLFLYMFLLIYGQMVMTSVIEEKGNRIIEVMVSSVTPFQLMLGKILGVASVAVVQIMIWAGLLMTISAIIPSMLPADVMQNVAAANSGAVMAGGDTEMIQAIAMISNVGYILELFLYVIIFLIGGFLLYAAMFAAIGASVDNIQDASQLQLVATLPIILSLVLMMSAVENPNSQLAIWCSMIPFTSPIMMMARIPFGIPFWQILVSIVILYLSFVAMVWFSAKIYRVGIFMYGKKPSLKEMIKWIRYK